MSLAELIIKDEELKGDLQIVPSLEPYQEKERWRAFSGKDGILTVEVFANCPDLMLVGGEIANFALQHGCKELSLDATSSNMAPLVQGLLLRSIQLPYFGSKERSRIEKILVRSSHPAQFEPVLALAQGVCTARTLTALPANRMSPPLFADACLRLQEIGLDVKVVEEEELKKIGAGALLAVSQGSYQPPRLVTLRWRGDGQQKRPHVLVGKGVCFDTGGINIKTAHLLEMKWDKAAAGAVVGTLEALARQNYPGHVLGVVGLVENMVDGRSVHPGDVVDSLGGPTIEIVDTDNEGRLVLADCLAYAQKIADPETLIVMGTLTPETFATLADHYAGLYTDDQELKNELIAAGERSYERVWPLPMGEPFARMIASDIADIKNMGIPEFGDNGAAAEFLRCFIKNGVRWAFLDIAGVAWSKEARPLATAGVNGFGTHLLVSWLKALVQT